MTAPVDPDEVIESPHTTAAEWEAAVLLAKRAAHPAALPDTWEDRADELQGLLVLAAIAKGVAVRAHAQAWLAGSGPAVQRDQQARLAGSGAQLAAEVAKARVEAYRLLIDAERLAALGD